MKNYKWIYILTFIVAISVTGPAQGTNSGYEPFSDKERSSTLFNYSESGKSQSSTAIKTVNRSQYRTLSIDDIMHQGTYRSPEQVKSGYSSKMATFAVSTESHPIYRQSATSVNASQTSAGAVSGYGSTTTRSSYVGSVENVGQNTSMRRFSGEAMENHTHSNHAYERGAAAANGGSGGSTINYAPSEVTMCMSCGEFAVENGVCSACGYDNTLSEGGPLITPIPAGTLVLIALASSYFALVCVRRRKQEAE